jgi:hypothetical protein
MRGHCRRQRRWERLHQHTNHWAATSIHISVIARGCECLAQFVCDPYREKPRQGYLSVASDRDGSSIRTTKMNAAARQTLRELRALGNIQTYLRTARAELASNPCDESLRAFIAVVEALLAAEKAKLAA